MLLAASVLGMTSFAIVGCTNPHTPTGHEGYVFEDPRVVGEGGFRGVVRSPGNYGLSAFRNRIINIDPRPTTYTGQFRILVKDDLNVALSVHAVMKAKQGEARSVVNIGDTIAVALSTYFEHAPFEVVRLAVGNIDYPPVVSQAVEKKLAAKQLLEGANGLPLVHTR